MYDLKEIIWNIPDPYEIPCVCCRKEISTHRGKVMHNEVIVNVCLCPECLQKSDVEIILRSLTREERC